MVNAGIDSPKIQVVSSNYRHSRRQKTNFPRIKEVLADEIEQRNEAHTNTARNETRDMNNSLNRINAE